MSTPIIEQIAVEITAAINAITAAAGFSQTLTAIRPRRVDFSDVTPQDKLCMVVQENEDRIENPALGCAEWMQPFAIMAIIIDSDAETDSIDTRRNLIRADIQKKLREDPTRGGLAIDTELAAGDGFDYETTGVLVRVNVHFRVLEDDPYTQA